MEKNESRERKKKKKERKEGRKEGGEFQSTMSDKSYNKTTKVLIIRQWKHL